MKTINVLLAPLNIVISLIIDILIFNNCISIKLSTRDKINESIVFVATLCFALIADINLRNIGGTFIEIVGLSICFLLLKKKVNTFLIIGSILIFSVFDTILYLLNQIFYYLMLDLTSFISILTEIISYLILKKYIIQIRKLITDKNGKIFVGILLYLYLVGIGIEFYTTNDNKASEVIVLSAALLLLQTIFAFVLYFVMVHTENNLLSKKEQEKQKLENKLLTVKNQHLQEKQNKLIKEHQQLREYADYLDKNEDDLRKFKHDYQNMLNSLIISAKNGKSKELVQKLKEYTDSHIDEKALRKYAGINRLHDETLKSITITKLTKLYNAGLDYNFGCNTDIYKIPSSINFLDISRVIGIAFDNAYEESIALQKKTGNPSSAKIEAMYYLENETLEFEIRNRIRDKDIDTKKISHKNYTTKKNHMGIGLANVMDIAEKYKESMLVNYTVEDGWFIFDLTILP
ncbi:two-component system sensor histidine kinase AgrC [Lactobacillus colini]|uniref:Two-component system sensor histidine kinase AgrC n=1 Tax=Lactobacillus colini TaxID=1819254 RepID=A0ABS4MCG6_9LACO|nr:GHKL domain-containing protein [Lactobacillus colini]MBP2057375.1 two-component system sensor histidine kinase AgrC [Lactobacillus colini]